MSLHMRVLRAIEALELPHARLVDRCEEDEDFEAIALAHVWLVVVQLLGEGMRDIQVTERVGQMVRETLEELEASGIKLPEGHHPRGKQTRQGGPTG